MNKTLIDFQTIDNFTGDINSLCMIESIKKSEGGAQQAVEETKEEAPKVLDFNVDPKYDWYQNASHIFISMRIKKGDLRQTLEVSFGRENLEVENCGHSILDLKLSNPITSAQSNYTCGMKKIEFKLKKEAENFNWASLEAIEGQTQTSQPMAPVVNSSVPSYPSSSKSKKNWDKVDSEVSKELNDEKPEGDAALNGLFKQIYGRADEATKRAMMKSYQTSGGTVLSTNWGEVAEKDYEGKDRPDAPAG